MGSPDDERGRDANEGPQREVRVPRFALSRTEVTVDAFRRFVEATGRRTSRDCYAWTGREWTTETGRSWENTGFAQSGDHPVACVSWEDARAYAAWLSAETGAVYRLPTEAEWEYAARADRDGPRSAPRYFWGDWGEGCSDANWAGPRSGTKFPDWKVSNCRDGYVYTAPVGSFPANDFKLHDTAGNLFEWVVDCWHDDYEGAPLDGSAWMEQDDGDCSQAVLRGGSWDNAPKLLRSANREAMWREVRFSFTGFRLARTLPERPGTGPSD